MTLEVVVKLDYEVTAPNEPRAIYARQTKHVELLTRVRYALLDDSTG